MEKLGHRPSVTGARRGGLPDRRARPYRLVRPARYRWPGGSQRRWLAVLFADISGFTELVDSAGPEAVYAVVRPLMDELVRRVNRHGGEVQQVLGDGFMAAFGLRSQDGAEPDRAVHAGLALVATGTRGRHPPVHVGIEYGEVLVTPSWEPAGFAAWGRPVTLASRLCDLAGPGCVQIGPGAYARVRPAGWSATPAEVHLKGVAGAVLAHRLTASAGPAAVGMAATG